tara:strand:- start:9062 stop:10495 length:1434 start_codon:yes stop_codon:yes gene_type:complete
MIQLKYANELHIKVECEPAYAQELSDYFTFDVPGAKFMPAVRKGHWDGKIRLFNSVTRTIYAGLTNYIVDFCHAREYSVEVDKKLTTRVIFEDSEVDDLAKSIQLTLEPRDYQKNAIAHAVRNRRCLLLSPTASGKSLIIYMLCRHYATMKKLIVVPTTALVHQMASDFEEYGYSKEVQKITAGADKEIQHEITVTTWQSIYKLPKKWFKQFNVIVGDEAHLFKAKSLTNIMSKLDDTPYRFGFTGTLDGSETHRLVLEGLFGPVERVTTTADLIEKKNLADLKINICVLKHTVQNRTAQARAVYRDEINYLVDSASRNEFIINLCKVLEGNSLLLFNFVRHGQELFDMAKKLDKNCYFVHGGVKGEERNEIREIVEGDSSALIVASYGTFSTGINIKNLHNIVFGAPSKSKIRVLQSIGRSLRTHESKNKSKLYDIVDDLQKGKWINYTLKHYGERVKLYNEEQFEYSIHSYNLKE